MAISKFRLDVFWELMDFCGGFLSNNFWLLKKILSIYHRMSIFRSSYDNKCPYIKISITCIYWKYKIMGCTRSPFTWNLKKGIKKSDYQSNEPPLKLYDYPFHKSSCMPSEHNLKPLPRGLWEGRGVFILKDIISRLLTTPNNVNVSKFWLDVFGEMADMGGGLIASNHEWKEPFFEVFTTTNGHLKISIRYIWENTSCGWEDPPSDRSESWKRYYNFLLTIQRAPPKFTRSYFLYTPYMSPGLNLQPLPWGHRWGGVVFLKYVIDLSTTLNKITVSKFWLDVYWGVVGVGEVVAL